MRGIVRRVVRPLKQHPLQILGTPGFLAVLVVLWIFPEWPLKATAILEKRLMAVIMLGLGLLFVILWKVPKWQISHVLNLQDRQTAENAARQTLAQIIGGAVLLAGLFFTWANLKTTQETATKNQEIAREGQITDRYTKAIEQLGAIDQTGKKKLEVRLGGIYALERIAKESDKDHGPIMEVLTAYVRETAPWLPKEAQPSKGDQGSQEEPPAMPKQSLPKLAADIQAILTVLGRRTHTYGKGEEQRLNLAKTALGGADLAGAQLQGADLRDAQLQGAILVGAQLQGAYLREAQLERADLAGAQLERADLAGAQLQGAHLWDAQLQGAILVGAQLQGAHLWDAQLERAHLWGAELQGADLRNAQLQGADLRDAQLQGAIALMIEQLCITRTLYQARIDPPLMTQIQKQCPQLLENPSE